MTQRIRFSQLTRGLTFGLWLSITQPVLAEVGDPTIRTDHPQYAGEGAFQEIEDCVRFATADKQTAQQQAISLYLWMLTHQYHLMSPQEWSVPGRAPDTANPLDYESVVYDANRARFSYGYGLCGTVHAWNEPYWQTLGLKVRRRAFPGHVNSEVFYDGRWHAFDTDMAGLLFRTDGQVAGYDDIIRDPKLAESVKPPLPHYPFAWPSDFETMKKGWQQVAAGGSWYSLYNGGYAAHPGIVQLRAGESFTRWFDRDHFGGPQHRRFWHHLAGGPQRNWTFMNSIAPQHSGDKSNARNEASYCNGEFVYQPDLSSPRSRDGVHHITGQLGHQSSSPKLYSRDGGVASITFRHFSPYVICGDPADDANPMTGPATGGLVVEGRVSGYVPAALSNDGLMWHEIELEEDDQGRFHVDLTDIVKGRYGWQMRFWISDNRGIDELKFTTVTQVAQGIYPRLTPNGCQVDYQCGSRGVIALLPDFSLPEQLVEEKFEATRFRSKNLEYKYRGPKQRLAYQARDNRPAEVVFHLKAPAELLEIRAAARYQLPQPPPPEADYRLEFSMDDGNSWTEFGKSQIPADNEFSSGWLAATADVTQTRKKQVLVKVKMDAGPRPAGLIDFQLYGIYRIAPPQAVMLEYGWLDEQQKLQTYQEKIPPTAGKHRLTVPTGAIARDDFVRLIAD